MHGVGARSSLAQGSQTVSVRYPGRTAARGRAPCLCQPPGRQRWSHQAETVWLPLRSQALGRLHHFIQALHRHMNGKAYENSETDK